MVPLDSVDQRCCGVCLFCLDNEPGAAYTVVSDIRGLNTYDKRVVKQIIEA